MKAKTYKELAPPPFAVGDRVRLSEMGSFILRAPMGTKGTVTKRGICTVTVRIDGEEHQEAWAPDFWVREA